MSFEHEGQFKPAENLILYYSLVVNHRGQTPEAPILEAQFLNLEQIHHLPIGQLRQYASSTTATVSHSIILLTFNKLL